MCHVFYPNKAAIWGTSNKFLKFISSPWDVLFQQSFLGSPYFPFPEQNNSKQIALLASENLTNLYS